MVRTDRAREIAGVLLLLLTVLGVACGGDKEPGWRAAPESPRGAVRVGQPTLGVLGVWLGEYVTIEGVRAEDGKVGTRTLRVDTVGGKKLATPVSIWVRNLELPAKERCVLKGYESGEMIGTPPAVLEAAKEQGREAAISQAEWQWRPHFVALIVVEPKGLALPEEK